ncbi:HAD-IIIA family hydrolase [candidate division KSB1 bacterium]|nr:HAD-IIIA family hydrolase [candidate division KSB1 bacterium]
MDLKDKITKIRLILLDVDGVLTDESLRYAPDGEEIKIFNVKDGLGIKLAQAAGLAIGIISSRSSQAVNRRAHELGIEVVYQGYKKKIEAYNQIKKELFVSDELIAYIGDDLPDLEILKEVGFAIAVENGCEEVKKVVDFITNKPGGRGAVRDVIEMILREQGKWEQVVTAF